MSMRETNPAARTTLTRRSTLRLITGAAIATHIVPAQAEEPFPIRPISLFVPGLPGGAFDFMARPVTEHAAKTLGQPVVLDHKAGGGFAIAPAALVTAKSDGYTLSIVVSNIGRVSLMQRLPFDPLADLTYILQVCDVAVGISARSDLPFKTIPELVAYARENPGKITYGSPGVGSGAHIGMELLARKAGITLTHVPFRGMQEAIPAILGGHIMLLTSALEWKPYVETGQLRVLAMMTSERRSIWPDVPTLGELGYGSPLNLASFAIAGPKGLPAPIAARVHDAFKSAIDDPGVKAALVSRELLPSYRSGADFRRHLETVMPMEREIVTALRIGRKD